MKVNNGVKYDNIEKKLITRYSKEKERFIEKQTLHNSVVVLMNHHQDREG